MPRQYTKRTPTCHPDRPYRSKGLCNACYVATREGRRPEAQAIKAKFVPPVPVPKPEYQWVELQMRHSVNGVFYGPGRVRLLKNMAEAFLNTEFMAIEKEQSLNQQQAFIIGWGPGGPVKRQVPWAQFDTILQREG